MGRGRDGAKHSLMHRAAPHNKEFSSPKLTGAKAARVWVQFRAGVTLPDKVPDINSEHDGSKSALHDETDQRTRRAGTGDRLSSTSVQESEAAIGWKELRFGACDPTPALSFNLKNQIFGSTELWLLLSIKLE